MFPIYRNDSEMPRKWRTLERACNGHDHHWLERKQRNIWSRCSTTGELRWYWKSIQNQSGHNWDCKLLQPARWKNAGSEFFYFSKDFQLNENIISGSGETIANGLEITSRSQTKIQTIRPTMRASTTSRIRMASKVFYSLHSSRNSISATKLQIEWWS